jgi:hypothetical protein
VPHAGNAAHFLLLSPLDPALRRHVPLPGHAAVGAERGREMLPLTHVLRIVRAIILKGAALPSIAEELASLSAFVICFAVLALLRYRGTLD